MSHKTFDNNVVAIYKNKLALKLHKLAHVGMCVLEMSEVLMYEFHYDYIKNKHDNKSKIYSQTLLVYRNNKSKIYLQTQIV